MQNICYIEDLACISRKARQREPKTHATNDPTDESTRNDNFNQINKHDGNRIKINKKKKKKT